MIKNLLNDFTNIWFVEKKSAKETINNNREFNKTVKNNSEKKKFSLSLLDSHSLICKKIPEELSKKVALKIDNYNIKGSIGQGGLSDIPWIGIFDNEITHSAQNGYYIVYLFDEKLQRLYLSLNQGWTQYSKTYSNSIGRIMIKRNSLILKNLLEPNKSLNFDDIELFSKNLLARGYEQGNICSISYDLTNLPEDDILIHDLKNMIQVYTYLKNIIGKDILSITPDDKNKKDHSNANEINVSLNYYFLNSRDSLEKDDLYPAIVLKRNSWDDYNFKTTFELTYYESKETPPKEIGYTKIFNKNDKSGYTTIKEDKFAKLDKDFCSIGQHLEFYDNIKKLGLSKILKDLRDCTVDLQIIKEFKHFEGVKHSLLRSGIAHKFWIEAEEKLKKTYKEKDFSFNYLLKLNHSMNKTNLNFNFKKQELLFNRINLLVGNNGTGKSQILSKLSVDFSGLGSFDTYGIIEKKSNESIFGNIHVVSYSPFDVFKDKIELNEGKITKNIISSNFLSYNFFGIRKLSIHNSKEEIILKSHNEIKKELVKNFDLIIKQQRLTTFIDMLKICINKTFKRKNISELVNNYESYSSGQKILIKMISDILSKVNNEDLILIDEPETYLHPQAISSFYHCLQKMLEYTNSYCIMTTHSPIIVQETPSKFVQILTLRENEIIAKKPKTETLGQGINSIINETFKIEPDNLNFFNTLDKFHEKGYSLEQLEQTLGNKLDFSVKSYYLSLD